MLILRTAARRACAQRWPRAPVPRPRPSLRGRGELAGPALVALIAPVLLPARLLAAGLLLVLALRQLRSVDFAAPGREPAPAGRTYATVLALTLVNPATVIYFATLAVGLPAIATDLGARTLFVLGAVLASLSCAWLLAAWARRSKPLTTCAGPDHGHHQQRDHSCARREDRASTPSPPELYQKVVCTMTRDATGGDRGRLATPFVKAGTDLASADVLDLATAATAETLARNETNASSVDEIIYATFAPRRVSQPGARDVLALDRRPASTRRALACLRLGLRAITDARITSPSARPTRPRRWAESLSNVPITYTPSLSRALVAASQSKTLPQKVSSFAASGSRISLVLAPGI